MGLHELNIADRDAVIRTNWVRAMTNALPGRQIISNDDLALYIGWWNADVNGPKNVLLDIWEKHHVQGI